MATSRPSFRTGVARRRTDEPADTEIELVVAAGSSVRRRATPVRKLGLDVAMDQLIEHGSEEGASASIRAWATAAQLALDLVARGRLMPARSPAGNDAWRLG